MRKHFAYQYTKTEREICIVSQIYYIVANFTINYQIKQQIIGSINTQKFLRKSIFYREYKDLF